MPRHPNILIITTHDTGRHFGCYGVPTVNTPAIDRIAGQGVRMSNYFSVVPICSASRACMLTGHYPQINGQLDLPVFGQELNDPHQHLSHRLRDVGYRTHLFGIQHETADVDRLGFDTTHALRSAQGRGRAMGSEVAQAVAGFLDEAKRDDRPFYAQVGLFETHSPFTSGDAKPDHSRGVYVPPYLKPTGPAYELLAQLQGAVRQADRAVEAIDEALQRAGLANDTLLIVTTDHGVELPRAKWNLYDPGMEVAMIARWPNGGIAAGTNCDWLSSHLDFVPTLFDLIGVPLAEPVAGASLAAGMRGKGAPPHDAVFGFYLKSEARSIRTDRFKLILNGGPRALRPVPFDISDTSSNHVLPVLELFDLHDDPLESVNLAKDPAHAAQRDELLSRLWQWMTSVDDHLFKGPWLGNLYDQAMDLHQQWRQQQ